mgnify:CR=1 FL=1
MNKIKLLLATVFVCFLLAGCTSTKLAIPETEGEKLQILYSNAIELVRKKDFVDAIQSGFFGAGGTQVFEKNVNL